MNSYESLLMLEGARKHLSLLMVRETFESLLTKSIMHIIYFSLAKVKCLIYWQYSSGSKGKGLMFCFTVQVNTYCMLL